MMAEAAVAVVAVDSRIVATAAAAEVAAAEVAADAEIAAAAGDDDAEADAVVVAALIADAGADVAAALAGDAGAAPKFGPSRLEWSPDCGQAAVAVSGL